MMEVPVRQFTPEGWKCRGFCVVLMSLLFASLLGGCFLFPRIEHRDVQSPALREVARLAVVAGSDEFQRVPGGYQTFDLRFVDLYQLDDPMNGMSVKDWGQRAYVAAKWLTDPITPGASDRKPLARGLLEEVARRGHGLSIYELARLDAESDMARKPEILARGIEDAVRAKEPFWPSLVYEYVPLIEGGASTPQRAWETLGLLAAFPGQPVPGRPDLVGVGPSYSINNKELNIRSRSSAGFWLADKSRTGWLSIPAQPQLVGNPAPGEDTRFSASRSWLDSARAWQSKEKEHETRRRELAREMRELDREYAAEQRQREQEQAIRAAADAEEQRQQWQAFKDQYAPGGGIQGELNRQNERLLGGAGGTTRTPSRDPEPGGNKTVIYEEGKEPKVIVHQEPPPQLNRDLREGQGDSC